MEAADDALAGIAELVLRSKTVKRIAVIYRILFSMCA
jgi:hypothetical protein